MAPRASRKSRKSVPVEDVDVDNVFCLRVLTDRVKVPASRLNQRMQTYIVDILRSKYQNVCSRFGFVRDGPIGLVHVDDPEVQTAHLNGDCVCRVAFRAWVCNPSVGSCMRGIVMRSNKFGVMVAAGPVQCVLARAPVSDSLKSSDLDDLKIGETAVFRIAGVRYEVMDAFISAVGTLASEEDFDDDIDRVRASARDPDAVLQVAAAARTEDADVEPDDVSDASDAEADDDADADADDQKEEEDSEASDDAEDESPPDADIDDAFSSGADDDAALDDYSD